MQISPHQFANITVKLAQCLDRPCLQATLTVLAGMVVPDTEPAPARKRSGWPRGKPRGRRAEATPQRKRRRNENGAGANPRPLKPVEIRQRLPRALAFLRRELAAGAKSESMVRSLATEARIRPEVLAQAVDELGILQRKPDNGSEPLWRLPA